MKKIIIAMGLLLATSLPSLAQDACITTEEAKVAVITEVPDSSVVFEDKYVLQFTSPSKDMDFVVVFNEEGCAVWQTAVEKKPTYES